MKACILFLAVITCYLSPAWALPRASQPNALIEFDPALGQLPESITVNSEGDVFLAFAGSATIARFDGDGLLTTYAQLPLASGALALGVKFGPDGCLYALSGAFEATPAAAFLWRICEAHAVEQIAAFDPHGFPNDLVFDSASRIYVSDPVLGRIWRVEEGEVEVWLDHAMLQGNPQAPALAASHFGVDGLVFDKHQRVLYVGNLDYGEIIGISVDCEGEPQQVWLHAKDERLVGVDGLAMDRAGTLYAAVNGQDALAAISRHGKVNIIASGGVLDAPSSLVFAPASADHTLYIASFAINRALAGEEARPALLSLSMPVPGVLH